MLQGCPRQGLQHSRGAYVQPALHAEWPLTPASSSIAAARSSRPTGTCCRRGAALVAHGALRAPKHCYGGPEPFGTGLGILKWEREASGLLQSHLRVEQEKEWKRRRHELLRNDEAPLDELDPYARQEIEQQRARIRFKKFWDLMNERDRPWHYDTILHLCTALSPYTCRTYSSVTAGTMQGILSQRAQAQKTVRELRRSALGLRRRIIGMTLKMQHTAKPVSAEGLRQAALLLRQTQAGAGIAVSQLRRLQQTARATYQDKDYSEHTETLVPLLNEVTELCNTARLRALPQVERLRAELLRFQADLDERRLPRDGVIAFVQELRNRKLLEPWPLLTPDVEVGWRYPPAEYLREEVRGVRPTNATTNTSNTTTNATTNTNTTSSSSREDPGSSGRSSASGGDVGGEGDGGSGKSWKGRPGFGGYQGQDEEEYLDWEDDDGEVGVFGLEGGEFGLGMDGALSGGGGGGGAGAGQGSELDVMMASFAGGGVGRGGDGDVVRGGEGRTAWGGEGQLGS